MGITERQLRQVQKDGASHGGDRHAYFAWLYLRNEFPGLTDERAATQVAFQPSETGLNAFHLDKDSKNLLLFCCRWTPAYESFKDPFAKLLATGLDLIFAPGEMPESLGVDLDGIAAQILGEAPPAKHERFLKTLRAQLYENRALISQVLVHFVFNGSIEDVERSEVVRQLREDLQLKAASARNYFEGRHVSVASAFICERSNLRSVEVVPRARPHTLHVDHVVEAQGPTGELMRVGFASLADLGSMLRSIGPAFLERNVRAGLSEDQAPNRAISETLRRMLVAEDEDPRTFVFHHNGVTMAAERCDDSPGEVTLLSPRLLNGAQTVTTFERFTRENQLHGNGKRLKQIKVLCKIITRADQEFVTRVTINNNRQNPVMPWHLRANDLIQVQLQDWFAQTLGIYYERQENAFASQGDDELIRLMVVEDRPIKMLLLASTYLAVEGRIDKMSHMREVFESDRVYGDVFHEGRLKEDPRTLLVCYKTQRVIAKLLSQFGEKSDPRYAFLYRSRNLLWALLCQAFLHDAAHREALSEEHGTDLVVSQEFRALMGRYARTRVRPILNAIVREDPYASYLAEERYGFLSTRAIFDRAMEKANVEYGWDHRGLR